MIEEEPGPILDRFVHGKVVNGIVSEAGMLKDETLMPKTPQVFDIPRYSAEESAAEKLTGILKRDHGITLAGGFGGGKEQEGRDYQVAPTTFPL